MTLVRTGEPAAEPVTLAEVKNHLRIAHDSENDLLQGLIRAAREDLERATGMALIDQTWRLVLDGWPARIHFDMRPEALRVMNGVEIDFSAGFGEAGTDVPDLLRRAIILLAAHWYEFRASFGAADQPLSYPGSYERIVARYRLRRL